MAIRKCPKCLCVVSVGEVAARSNEAACPGCRQPLEVAAVSRYIATVVGLAAGVIVYRLTAHGSTGTGLLGWVLPIVYGYLAMSIVSPLVLMFSADLRLRSEPPAPAPAEPAPGPASSH